MHLPVKRVEIHAGKQKYGTAGSTPIRNSVDDYENHTARKDDAETDNKTRTLSNIHLQQEQPTAIPAWSYGEVNRCAPAQTYKHEKESPDDFSSEDSFKARRLPTLPPGLAVPSAMTGLASLFGMGRGGSPSL